MSRQDEITNMKGDNNNRLMGWFILIIPVLVMFFDYVLDEPTSLVIRIFEFILIVIGSRLLYVNRDQRRSTFLKQISPFN